MSDEEKKPGAQAGAQPDPAEDAAKTAADTERKDAPEAPEGKPEAQAQPEAAQDKAEKPEKHQKHKDIQEELKKLQSELGAKQESFLRLAAEYDNYRKRSAREKESAWADAKAATVEAFLPVYDNLERAVKQHTEDAAYAKGVEMTLTQLQEVFRKLNVEIIEAEGQNFDPNIHNAVMHVEDENLGENVVAEVFQAGFRTGDKVIRCAMVKVAN